MSRHDHGTDARERVWAVSVWDAWNHLVLSDGVRVTLQVEPNRRTGVFWVDAAALKPTETGDDWHIVARQSGYWPNAQEVSLLGYVWSLLMSLEKGVEEWKRQQK